jgi:hypothetical protein
MRRIAIVSFAAALVLTALVLRPEPVSAQKRIRVELPDGTVLAPTARPVLTQDGSVGFVAPASGPTLVVFAVRTGEVLSKIEGLGHGASLSLDESGARRLLAVTIPGDELERSRAAVAVFDDTTQTELAVVSTFVLPENVTLAPHARAVVAIGQRIGVVAISSPVAAILSFDVAAGEQVGALTLGGVPDSIAVLDRPDDARIAVVSSAANQVAILSLGPEGVLLPLSAFSAPIDAPIASVNNAVFGVTGDTAYVASLEGEALFSLSVETGAIVDRLATGGSPASISVYRDGERDKIAVVNVSRPGGEKADGAEPDAKRPLGLPGAVVALAERDGRLSLQSRFLAETADENAPANNADWSADGGTIYVPVRTGSFYAVSAATGEAVGKESIDGRVQSIASAPLAETVAIVTGSGSAGSLELLSIAPSVLAPAETPEAETPEAKDATTSTDDSRDEAKADRRDKQGALAIKRITPGIVQSGRRHDLPVTVIGSGFQPGAVVVANGEPYPTEVGEKSKRLNFTLAAALLASPGSISIEVHNPDGNVSNAVALTVNPAATPLVGQVRPGVIPSGNDGVDLQIRGDHFRNGAVVRATYVDPAGVSQTVDLKTYRLSFTHMVARLPAKLRMRAEEYTLTVVDRDGVATSEPTEIKVVGPSVSSVVPDRAVAGDLEAGETLTLRITGSNFHRDAIVLVRRPPRGTGGDETFRRIPASSVRWRNPERINVKLTAVDLAYSGDLVVRIVNPIPGERGKNGDAADSVFAVAGPVIMSTTPEVILAGTDAFFLKLDGVDFRRGATVKLQRADGTGEVTAKVVVEDPAFKDRKRINVALDTPELLRLVSHPGTLSIRVINPSLGKGDPSAAATIRVVAPEIAEYLLLPSRDDDEYRLTLTGQYFAPGAKVLLLTTDDEPVGDLREAKVKSDTEITIRLGRKRVTNLRVFKAIVVNPGGDYNEGGVASNAIDVAVE